MEASSDGNSRCLQAEAAAAAHAAKEKTKVRVGTGQHRPNDDIFILHVSDRGGKSDLRTSIMITT